MFIKKKDHEQKDPTCTLKYLIFISV